MPVIAHIASTADPISPFARSASIAAVDDEVLEQLRLLGLEFIAVFETRS
jgi:hypothetical protein